MIVSSRLLADLKGQLKLLETDLRAQSDDPEVKWARDLSAEHRAATERGRTALTWSVWRDGEVAQAAVAWLLASTFVRFCEDNRLLDGARTPAGGHAPVPWITGPVGAEHGDRFARAVEHQTAYFEAHPTANDRDWLRESFTVLASLPAGRGLVDPNHNPMWAADISAEAARTLLAFWRGVGGGGHLFHDFTDPQLDTRFLGDLYQDLSEHAKKKYALLQTPVFVEEFILDQTLEPAVREFGLEGLMLIDATCGSAHFLLGAFARLNAHWQVHAPALDARQRVQKALDSISGVDLNPFAIAIARFRLTVAALSAAGEPSLVTAPAFAYHLAIGDSLLGEQGTQDDLFLNDSGGASFAYAAEDLGDYRGILTPGRYHVVVGNAPYITVKDPALSKAYRRQAYKTCHRQYALSVPFMELFFRLARREGPDGGAGYVGQITSNSFMKREFGTKLIEDLLSGSDTSNPVDLSLVIDSQGAWIPGHNFKGTPTVILVGRRRPPKGDTVRAILGVRGEPGQPADPSKGLVWTEIVEHFAEPTFNGTYVTITNLDRSTLSTHPWSLSGGGASALMALIGEAPKTLGDFKVEIGRTTVVGDDDAWIYPSSTPKWRLGEDLPMRQFVTGEQVRDYEIHAETIVVNPYRDEANSIPVDKDSAAPRHLWPVRAVLSRRVVFGKGFAERGLPWWVHLESYSNKLRTPLSITYAEVTTHNHFVLDRSRKIFKQTAPVIKLPASATEDDHLSLLAILNTSTACFWLKQVTQMKGGDADQPWARTYQFNATKVSTMPIPSDLSPDRGRVLDRLATTLAENSPGRVVTRLLTIGDPTETKGERSSFSHPGARTRGESVSSDSVRTALINARRTVTRIRSQLVFEQEELDWDTYRQFGLVNKDLTYQGDPLGIRSEERPFAIVLARGIQDESVETTWYSERTHRFIPTTEFPDTRAPDIVRAKPAAWTL